MLSHDQTIKIISKNSISGILTENKVFVSDSLQHTHYQRLVLIPIVILIFDHPDACASPCDGDSVASCGTARLLRHACDGGTARAQRASELVRHVRARRLRAYHGESITLTVASKP